ncbi:MAG TPA: DUF1553 domain-containing protein [Verrucomicrobiae bacterium]|nr:DUF1553 domain-containing protein [Verrucomicrobiae bacterium]
MSFLPGTIRTQRNAGGARAALVRGGAAWALVPGVVVLLVCHDSRAADALWAAHVEPLLKKHCVECHNPDKAKSALDLTSLQSILRGGDRGASVIPGRPDDSNLYKFLSAASDPHMPPGNRKKLNDEEAGLIKAWIEKMAVVGAEPQAATLSNVPPVHPLTPAKPRIAWKPSDKLGPSQVVDRFLELGWKLDKVEPAKRASDEVFVRRVYLDLAGRIPTRAEAEAFVRDPGREKRARLIDQLLAGDEYPRHLREVFDPVLMDRRGADWEDRRENEKWFAWLEGAFRSNRPWNEVVRDLIVARPGRAEERGAVWFLYERENNAQAVAEALAPVVFGVQMKCAQCHDHMVAREIKQAHYWGMVAAFNRSKNVNTPAGPGVAESAIGGFVSFANLKKESQPARLVFFNGRRVDETWPKAGEKETDSPDFYLVPPPASTPNKEAPKDTNNKPPRRGREAAKVDQPAEPKFSRRQALADAVTQDNPLLARAMVNRVWAMLFGRGLVHPVDLMDSKHPVSQPELLDWLARDFEKSGYDLKRLLRTLCNTKAYQLESRAPAPAAKPKSEPAQSFARALDKPLSAEQLFRSLLVASGNALDKDGRTAGFPEKELRRAFVAQFPDLFPAEYNASLQQAMFLSNSRLMDQLVKPASANLAARLMASSDNDQRVREAFLTVYGRSPDREELRACAGYLTARSPEAGVSQLLWALLTSAEFQLNH